MQQVAILAVEEQVPQILVMVETVLLEHQVGLE
jgi:hypothetical protein